MRFGVYFDPKKGNLFPSQMAVHSRAELEEERRLFYVALTRAEKFAQLSYTTSRFRWGQLIDCEPSRFLQEIDETYLDWHFQKQRPSGMPKNKTPFNYKINANKNQPFNFKKEANKPIINTTPKFTPSNLTKATIASKKSNHEPNNSHLLQSGMLVEHLKFGVGKIIQIDNESGNKKAVVFFKSVGQKQLLLKFAKLKIIN